MDNRWRQMSIRERLAKQQRIVFLTGILGSAAIVVARLVLPPRWALLVIGAAIVAMLAALVYLYRAARCPRCSTKLWLSLNKLAPVPPFKPRLDHCPGCGVSVSDPAVP